MRLPVWWKRRKAPAAGRLKGADDVALPLPADAHEADLLRSGDCCGAVGAVVVEDHDLGVWAGSAHVVDDGADGCFLVVAGQEHGDAPLRRQRSQGAVERYGRLLAACPMRLITGSTRLDREELSREPAP
jgi:hypothetical protein